MVQMFLALWYRGQLSLPRKTEANRQAKGSLNSASDVDLASTWGGKGRMWPATLMSLILHGFPAICNTFGRIYGNQIQFGFHTFLYPLEIHFSSCFSFCVWENGTFSKWVSHNNEERTIKLIQDIRMYLWTLESHYYWMPLNVAS